MVDSSHINCDEDGDVMKRKYYIDNIRWIFILVLIPFHAAMAWNGWEGNYIWFEPCKPLSAFVIFVDPPYMATLFVLAGMFHFEDIYLLWFLPCAGGSYFFYRRSLARKSF